MKNFRYDAPEKEAEIEYILKTRKRKINRQQMIFLGLFIAAIFSIAYYIGYHYYYTEVDGYIHAEVNEVRAPGYILLLKTHARLGDLVEPGDTLYSYLYLEHFVSQENMNEEIGSVVAYRKAHIEFLKARNELGLTRTRIAELKKNIEIQDHNISLGLSDNVYKLELERQLKETQELLSVQLANLRVMQAALAELNRAVDRSGIRDTTVQYQTLTMLTSDSVTFHKGKLRSYLRYGTSRIRGFVTDINAPDGAYLFGKERIMVLQGVNPTENNIYAVAYVPFELVENFTRQTPATVIVNDELHLKARVTVQGARVEELPVTLRSNFSRQTGVNISVLTFEPGQVVPFWAISRGVPIRVRIKNTEVVPADTIINVHL